MYHLAIPDSKLRQSPFVRRTIYIWHTHTYIHTNVYICTCVYTVSRFRKATSAPICSPHHINICIHTHTFIHTFIYVHVPSRDSGKQPQSPCVCRTTCIYIHTHTFIHTYTYVHVYIPSRDDTYTCSKRQSRDTPMCMYRIAILTYTCVCIHMCMYHPAILKGKPRAYVFVVPRTYAYTHMYTYKHRNIHVYEYIRTISRF